MTIFDSRRHWGAGASSPPSTASPAVSSSSHRSEQSSRGELDREPPPATTAHLPPRPLGPLPLPFGGGSRGPSLRRLKVIKVRPIDDGPELHEDNNRDPCGSSSSSSSASGNGPLFVAVSIADPPSGGDRTEPRLASTTTMTTALGRSKAATSRSESTTTTRSSGPAPATDASRVASSPSLLQSTRSSPALTVRRTLLITRTTASRLVRAASSSRRRRQRAAVAELSGDHLPASAATSADLVQDHPARNDSSEKIPCQAPLLPPSPMSSPDPQAQQLQRVAAAALARLERREKHRQRHPALASPDEAAAVARRSCLLLPTSSFWVVWNSLHLVALAYVCTVVPYLTALAPDDDVVTRWSEPINRLLDGFYALDLVVNFRACFVDADTGTLVTGPGAIAVHYLRSGWLLWDALMAVPFDLVLRDAMGQQNASVTLCVRLLRLLRLAKLLRVLRLQPLLEYCEDALGISRNKLIVVQLILRIVLVAHLTACGFILVATIGRDEEPTPHAGLWAPARELRGTAGSWIDRNGLGGAPAIEIYVAALYWAFTMMTTVGFGDIVPMTLVERVYSILAMLISAGTYAYVIASISSIVALMNLEQTRFYERINELNAYMASRQLPAALQLRTRQFFRYYLTKKSVFDEHALFEALPTNLREELVEHYVTTAMQHLAGWHDPMARGFTAQIALFLRPVFFPPDSLVIKAQEVATELFFISKGTFEVVVDPAIGLPVRILKMGARSKSHRRTSSATPSPPPSPPAPGADRSPTMASALRPFSRNRRRSHDNPSEVAAGAPMTTGAGPMAATVAVLRDGDYFGEMALFCGDSSANQRRLASVRAQTYCELHTLTYEHLLRALERFSTVRKRLQATAMTRLDELQRHVRASSLTRSQHDHSSDLEVSRLHK